MATMLFTYPKEAQETIGRMVGNRIGSYYPNKYYKSAEGNFYYYRNTKGYYHIVRPCRIRYEGEFSHYEIIDYLLTKDNTLKETKCSGFFKTSEECIKRIEENLAPTERN